VVDLSLGHGGIHAFIFDHSALCARFPRHKYPLTLFEPIGIASLAGRDQYLNAARPGGPSPCLEGQGLGLLGLLANPAVCTGSV
jgi:hypothetical protein